jgi:hypothetical protein
MYYYIYIFYRENKNTFATLLVGTIELPEKINISPSPTREQCDELLTN